MHNNESVSLYDRFELLNLDRDDGVKTFEAREISTGRPVKVHLFVQAGAPLQAALLKAVDRLQGDERQRVLDRGKHEGTPYVVTDRLVDYPGLSEWVQAASRPTKPDSTEPTKEALESAGAWKLPQTPPASKPSSPSLNQQFAELFPTAERPILPPETVILPPPTRPAAAAPPRSQPPPAAQPPGEFTRMFQAPVTAAPDTGKSNIPAARPMTPPPSKEPGEFTRMFQSPAGNPAPQTPSAAPASSSNDFERFFEPSAPAGPMPRSPVLQQPLTPQAPGNAGPNRVGEFTRMFGKVDLGVPAPPAAPAPPKEAGEFTRMFQAPSGPPAPPAAPPAAAPPPATPPFAAQPVASAPLAKSAGPGEYTRQFSAPAPMTLGQPVATPPATPPPAPASLGTPPMTAPAPPPPQKNNLPLILGIAAIVVVAIIIVVIFAMRPK